MNEESQRIETYTIVILGCKLRFSTWGLSTCTFCEELWPNQNYMHICMGLYGPLTRQVFEMASLAVTWMSSWNLWPTNRQRSGQVYHIVLPREAYYSSQVSRMGVVSALLMNGTIE